MTAPIALPPFPQQLPKTQADWTAVANTFQQWRQLLQGQKWVAPTLLNGWTNYGGTTAPAGYLLDATNRVWLRGFLNGGSATANTAAFALPWASPYQTIFGTIAIHSGGYIAARVDVNGVNVVPVNIGGSSGDYVSLDGLSFSLLP